MSTKNNFNLNFSASQWKAPKQPCFHQPRHSPRLSSPELPCFPYTSPHNWLTMPKEVEVVHSCHLVEEAVDRLGEVEVPENPEVVVEHCRIVARMS